MSEDTNSGEFGYYDYSQFNVLLRAHDDARSAAVTTRHEYIHHELTILTGLGLVMKRMRETENTEILSFLADTCHIVHESCAVYGSIRSYNAKDLLKQLAGFYTEYYLQMATLVEPIFKTDFLTTMFSLSIARTCMMSSLIADRHYTLDSVKKSLPEDKWPDTRFRRIQEHKLLTKDAVLSELKSRMLADDWRRFVVRGRVRDDWTLPSDDVRNTSIAMMYTIFELLKPLDSDLEDEFRLWRLEYMRNQWEHEQNAGLKDTYDISRPLDQIVKSHDHDFPVSSRVFNEDIKEIATNSLDQTGTVYLYSFFDRLSKDLPTSAQIRHREDIEQTKLSNRLHIELYQTRDRMVYTYDISPNFGPTISLGNDLTLTMGFWHELEQIAELDNIDITTVIEGYNYAEWCRSRSQWSGLPKIVKKSMEEAFVFAGINPKNFIQDIFSLEIPITVSSFGVTYASGPAANIQGLSMVIYKLKGHKSIVFHLANAASIMSIMKMVRLYRSSGRSIRWNSGLHKYYDSRIRKLIEHPIMSFYLTGQQPSSLRLD